VMGPRISNMQMFCQTRRNCFMYQKDTASPEISYSIAYRNRLCLIYTSSAYSLLHLFEKPHKTLCQNGPITFQAQTNHKDQKNPVSVLVRFPSKGAKQSSLLALHCAHIVTASNSKEMHRVRSTGRQIFLNQFCPISKARCVRILSAAAFPKVQDKQVTVAKPKGKRPCHLCRASSETAQELQHLLFCQR
jgi:hypothetical protein